MFLDQYGNVSDKYENRPKSLTPIEELQSHAEYEGVVTNLHLMLDDVMDKAWAQFVCGAQQAMHGGAQSHETQQTGDMWKLEVVVGNILRAAESKRKAGQRFELPMLPPILGLPYAEDCDDEVLAAKVALAFDLEPGDIAAAEEEFVDLFGQQACLLFEARSKKCSRAGKWEYPKEVEEGARRIYSAWRDLMTVRAADKGTGKKKLLRWAAFFKRPSYMEKRVTEFMQIEMEDVLNEAGLSQPLLPSNARYLLESQHQDPQQLVIAAAEHELQFQEAAAIHRCLDVDILATSWGAGNKRFRTDNVANLPKKGKAGKENCAATMACHQKAKKPPRVGVAIAKKYLEKVRGRRIKAYSKCSKDQQAQDRAWLIACAGSKQELMAMVGDILNVSSAQEGLVDLLFSYVDEQVISTCRKAIQGKLHKLESIAQGRGSGEELDVDTTLALFFETDLSWHHYHTLTHVWRLCTESSDLRFPSRNRLYTRYMELKIAVVKVEVPGEDGKAGTAMVRSPEAGWEAARERVQQAADALARASDSSFQAFVDGTAKVILNLAADGFSVPDFDKKLVTYLQANLRVLMPGAASSGGLRAHIPMMLARCKETYEAYAVLWPHVEAPFVDAQGKPRTEMEVMWQGKVVRVRVEYRLSGDLKGSLILLGRQPPQSSRPCTACFTRRDEFGSRQLLHCREQALRKISGLHFHVLQSFFTPSSILAGACIMDYISQNLISSRTCPDVVRVLFGNEVFVRFMQNIDELYWLNNEQNFACDFVNLGFCVNGSVPIHLAECLGQVRIRSIRILQPHWEHVSAALRSADVGSEAYRRAVEIQRDVWSLGLCVIDGFKGFEWHWCRHLPDVRAMLTGVGVTQKLLAGIAMNHVKPSLSALIRDPSRQVIMETLHCVLNLVRTQFEAIKLMCNKFFAAHDVGVGDSLRRLPRPKSDGEIDSWDRSVRQDNSVRRVRWYVGGWVVEDDLYELLGFKEPMQGYHGNQCFVALEKWEAICDIPVLQMMDLKLGAMLWEGREKIGAAGWQVDSTWRTGGVLRQWLGGLHATCQQLRRTRPCVAKLQAGIDDWFRVVACISALDDKLYTCKAYDHFCGVHVLPMVAREGNVVQFATFSTEHDNSVIRHDLRGHTTSGGGEKGRVEELEQLFQRRAILRSLFVQSKMTWAPKGREIEIKSSCDCAECARRFARPSANLLPSRPMNPL